MLYVCADDYGLSEESVRHIDTCIACGGLNKISIFPNGMQKNVKDKFEEEKPFLCLHINLVEGAPVGTAENMKLLVSDTGEFKHSFFGLFLLSLSPKRKEFEKQLYEELCAQLRYGNAHFSENGVLSVDSHQHVHMIPLVFRTLMRAIRDEKITVNYLRYPAEPIMPYLKTPSLFLTYRPISLVKQWLLKLFGMINKKELKQSGIKTAYFMGILFSGHMDKKRVLKVLPHYLALARKNKRDVEILLHPGYEEKGVGFKKKFYKFYFSSGRKIEFDCVTDPEFKNITKEACEHAVH
ncbi:MAG: ChbG/HpnK family deacetylase [Clostridia bacterium]|nr:ChbG/HpnK family deacetylase [Clostridia bacterium]